MGKIKEIKLKLRAVKNKITGKQKIIDEYNKLTQAIAVSSDKEKDAEKKKELRDLYQEVTDEKWEEGKEGGGWIIRDHNPYTKKKKDTRKKIEIARQGLEKIRGR